MQFFQSVASARRNGNDRRTIETRALNLCAHLGHRFNLVSKIRLCDRNDRSFDPEVSQNLDVLFGLRHPSVVGRDDQQCEIDRADTSNHIAHESVVTRHINETCVNWISLICHQREFRETEIDGDSAFFFLGQPIRVGSGQRLDQRALAVIDVPGGCENVLPNDHV